jgi:signal transduction histidine kinase
VTPSGYLLRTGRRRSVQRGSTRRLLGAGVAVAIAYVAAAHVGFKFALLAEQVTTVWAPTGISLAALILRGTILWPAVWAGAFVVNATADVPVWTAAAVATGNTLEAVVATAILHRIAGFNPRLERLRDVLSFIAVAAASCAISASVGVLALAVSGVQVWQRVPALWWDWWVGDALGAVVVAPVIMTAARGSGLSRRQVAEAVLLVGGGTLAMFVVFGRHLGIDAPHYPLEYVIFPFVIGAAVRVRQPVTSLVVLGASAVTIWNTVQGFGPFAGPRLHDSLILLEAFMGVLAGTGLLLAAAIAERQTGERRRAAAFAVAEILATAPDLTSAAPHLLSGICENLEWQIGALWLYEPADERLHAIAQWREPGVTAPAFERATHELRYPAGTGLPGLVFATRTATWIDNFAVDPNFPRASLAHEDGLHGAFAVPIRLGAEVLGVIECFNRTVVPRDEDLLRTMSTLGHQVGQFIARKREEEAVRAARQQAEAANRAKDEFLATLSHELRTPLNAIVGWTRMLIDGTMDPARTGHALKVIDRNAQLTAQLIADILDVSRIITGALHLDVQPVQLQAIAGAALDAVRPAADARRVRLVARLAPDLPALTGDPQRLQQVVWNLLSNAVKFTPPEGTVLIELAETESRAQQVRVSDDGVGIDAAFLPHVFERFRQADSSPSRAHGGLGLGLAIVRHLVELHGGTVVAHSEGAGLGSTFTVTVPAGEEGLPEDQRFHGN